jgi:hypothetical protein
VTIILKDAIWGLTGPVLKEQSTTWNIVGGQLVTNLQREVNSRYLSLVHQKSYNGYVMKTLRLYVRMHSMT